MRQRERPVHIDLVNFHARAERRLERANSAHAVVVVRGMVRRHHLVAEALQEKGQFAILRPHIQHAPVPVQQRADWLPVSSFSKWPSAESVSYGIPFEPRHHRYSSWRGAPVRRSASPPLPALRYPLLPSLRPHLAVRLQSLRADDESPLPLVLPVDARQHCRCQVPRARPCPSTTRACAARIDRI